MGQTILVNLLSEQRIPNFIAVMHLGPDRVCALATTEFREQAPLFESMTGVAHESIPFDPYDFERDFNRVTDIVRQTPKDDELVINFTGGTKTSSPRCVTSCLDPSAKRCWSHDIPSMPA